MVLDPHDYTAITLPSAPSPYLPVVASMGMAHIGSYILVFVSKLMNCYGRTMAHGLGGGVSLKQGWDLSFQKLMLT